MQKSLVCQLRLCAGIATEGVAAIGIDGWAVDYVRLNEDGNQIANPFCYRDERTIAAEQQIHEILSPARLYALTGIQLLRINTLYQLYADQLAGADPRQRWLNLPVASGSPSPSAPAHRDARALTWGGCRLWHQHVLNSFLDRHSPTF